MGCWVGKIEAEYYPEGHDEFRKGQVVLRAGGIWKNKKPPLRVRWFL